jgi:hypothetical protein
MQSFVHWLKIDGTVPERDEAKQYREIQRYLDRHPDAAVTVFKYERELFSRAVKLECHQNYNNLDMSVNSGSHALKRLYRKPDGLCYPQPFRIPKRLQYILSRSTPSREAR